MLKQLLFFPIFFLTFTGLVLGQDLSKSNTPTPVITANHYVQGNFFNDDVTFYIADEVIEDSDKSSITISIALFNLEGEVVQTILQKYTDSPDYTSLIHSIEQKDINQDNYPDLIINLSENFAGISQINSYFVINTETEFKLLDISFKQDNYSFVSNSAIRVSEPLYSFGTPYENDSLDDKQSVINPLWINHYRFNKEDIEPANTDFMPYYKTLLKDTSKQLSKTLDRIKSYKMDSQSQDLNQLQLNEYFHDISTQKLIIQRCEAVIYTL